MSDVFERIVAFERELVPRISTRSEACRFGTAWFHEGFPRRWDSNFVWVDAALEGVSAEDLAADADDVLGRAGLEHRTIWVVDIVHGERLAPGFVELGYGVDRGVVMAHLREPDHWNDDVAEEVGLEEMKGFYRETNALADDGRYADVAEVLAAFHDVLAEHAGARFFGARVDGRVVAGCELYRLGDVAQIEDVATFEAHRGRGLARAVVLAAVRAAREDGADLVFLGADDEDWPKHLYAKLGFDEVGRFIDFVKEPPQRV